MSAERFQRKLLERKVREHVRLGAGEGPQTTPATAEPLEATQPLGPHENPPEVGQGPPGGLPERSVVPVPRVALATLNTGVLVLALITKTTTT